MTLSNRWFCHDINLDGKSILSPDEYNSIIIELRSNIGFDAPIEIIFNEPISAFIYDSGFNMMDQYGNNIDLLLPIGDKFLIPFPDIRVKNLAKCQVYTFTEFTFDESGDYSYSSYNTSIPNYSEFIEKKCYISRDSNYIICHQYKIKRFMSYSNIIKLKESKFKFTDRDVKHFEVLNPIVIELNEIENRLMPYGGILPTVELEFNDKCHLTGKLIRNNKCIVKDEMIYLREARGVLRNLSKSKELPLIANHDKLGQYNTKNKEFSIIPKGKVIKDFNDYITTIENRIYDLENM